MGIDTDLENVVEIHQAYRLGKTILCLLVKMIDDENIYIYANDIQLDRQIVFVRGEGDAGWTRELFKHQDISRYKRSYHVVKPRNVIFSNFQDPSRTFVGRKEELDDLDCILRAVPYRVPVILGSAGIGKTEFAIKYAQQFREYYQGGTLLVHAEGFKTLCEALTNTFHIKNIRDHFGIIDDVDTSSASPEDYYLLEIYPAFERIEKNVLILLDNVDCLDMLSNAEFDTYFPERLREKIHLYATTRMNSRVYNSSDVAVVFNLEGLTKEDSMTLLKSKRPFMSPEEQLAAEEIVEYSNGNAWMLDLLSESIKQVQDNESDVYRFTLERLKSLPFETLRTEEGVRIKKNVLDALELLKPTLNKLPDESLRVLQYSALCTPETVYLEWLQRVYEHQIGRKADEREWNKLIRPLFSYHLWTKNEGKDFNIHPNVRMHRLTQIVVRKYLRNNVNFQDSAKKFLKEIGNYVHERDFICQEVISMGTIFCQQAKEEYGEETLPILYSLTTQKDLGDFLTHFRLFGLRRKVWEAAAEMIRKLDDANPIKNRYRASSYLYKGHIVLADNEYGKAIELYRKALDIRLREFGENNECTALLYSYIGSAYALSGNRSEVPQLFEKAIQVQSSYYEQCKVRGDVLEIVVAEETLVRLYRRVGEAQPEKMESYYENAIRLAEEIASQLPKNNLLAGETHLQYANMLIKKGTKDKALEHFRKAQVIYSEYLSPEDPILQEIGNRINNVAN